MAEPVHIEVGQLWAIDAILYRVESLNGPDACYPIVLQEVARDREALKEERATVANRHQGRPSLNEALGLYDMPRRMEQEPAFFARRTDVARVWGSTAEEWVATRAEVNRG